MSKNKKLNLDENDLEIEKSKNLLEEDERDLKIKMLEELNEKLITQNEEYKTINQKLFLKISNQTEKNKIEKNENDEIEKNENDELKNILEKIKNYNDEN